MGFEHLPYRPNVGMMVINAQGHVFVAQRIDNHSDAWQMPQGGVDAGEDIRAAALRELEEETGITPDLVDLVETTPDWLTYDLPDDLIPKLWNGKYRGQKQMWYLFRFTGSDDQINIETEHPEFSAWKWVSPQQLIAQIVPFKRDVYARVLDAFKLHL